MLLPACDWGPSTRPANVCIRYTGRGAASTRVATAVGEPARLRGSPTHFHGIPTFRRWLLVSDTRAQLRDLPAPRGAHPARSRCGVRWSLDSMGRSTELAGRASTELSGPARRTASVAQPAARRPAHVGSDRAAAVAARWTGRAPEAAAFEPAAFALAVAPRSRYHLQTFAAKARLRCKRRGRMSLERGCPEAGVPGMRMPGRTMSRNEGW